MLSYLKDKEKSKVQTPHRSSADAGIGNRETKKKKQGPRKDVQSVHNSKMNSHRIIEDEVFFYKF